MARLWPNAAENIHTFAPGMRSDLCILHRSCCSLTLRCWCVPLFHKAGQAGYHNNSDRIAFLRFHVLVPAILTGVLIAYPPLPAESLT